MGIRLGEIFLKEMIYDTYDDALDFFYKIESKDAESPSQTSRIVLDDDKCASCVRLYRKTAYEMFDVYKYKHHSRFANKYNISMITADYIVNNLLNYLACALIKANEIDTYIESIEIEDLLKERFNYDTYDTFVDEQTLMKLHVSMPNRGQINLCPATKVKTIDDFVDFFITILRYNYTCDDNQVTVRLIKYKPFDEMQAKHAAEQAINRALHNVDVSVNQLKEALTLGVDILDKSVMQQYYEQYKIICEFSQEDDEK